MASRNKSHSIEADALRWLHSHGVSPGLVKSALNVEALAVATVGKLSGEKRESVLLIAPTVGSIPLFMKPKDAPYLTRLDHLRFGAAALVLFWHLYRYNGQIPTSDVPAFPPVSLLQEGHTGVALFLTLSGYLFWWKCRDKQIEYWAFIRSRVCRIAPLFIFWMVIYFYLGDVDPVKLTLAIALMLNNGTVPGNGWTIIVEFQFYLLFPFLLIFSRSKSNRNDKDFRYLFGILALAICVRWSVWLTTGTVQDLAYGTIFGRIDQFIFGMIFSEIAIRRPQVFKPWRVLAGTMILVVTTVYLFDRAGGYFDQGGYPSKSLVWVFWPMVEGICFGLLIASYDRSNIRIPRIVDRFLARLGSYSYSMYLNHHFVILVAFALATYFDFTPTGIFAVTVFGIVAVLPLLCAVSAATYHLIEKPFDTLRKPYSQRLEAVDITAAAPMPTSHQPVHP
ncbi:acyltransferase [Neorhizobium sp. BT27B]|uniref:acyltransferase family protein n=1 Tax=Neorhizobium sp. BT27B TaxID=3142625 RepID=UPI003D26C327